jgi:purine-binding chemotaxis protein CheW
VKVESRLSEAITEQQLQLLERRAARLREKPAANSDEAVLWVAEFPIGDESYGLPLDGLRAAVPLKMVTPVPLSPPHVIGILRFQGQVLTAMSLASLLGGRGWREDPAVLLVVDPGMGGRLVAVDCERIPKPVPLPLPLVEAARARTSGSVADVTLPGMQQINLVDLRRLLDRRTSEKRNA